MALDHGGVGHDAGEAAWCRAGSGWHGTAVLVREQVSYGGADRRLGSAGKYDAVALAGDNGSGARGGAAAVWRRQRGRRRARAVFGG